MRRHTARLTADAQPSRWSEREAEAFRLRAVEELRRSGCPVFRIAWIFNVTRGTIYNWQAEARGITSTTPDRETGRGSSANRRQSGAGS